MKLFIAYILHLYHDSWSNCDFSETIQTTNYKKQKKVWKVKSHIHLFKGNFF